MNISDDILIYGWTQDKHDKTSRRHSNNLVRKTSPWIRLNAASTNPAWGTLDVFPDKGVSPDPKKVEAIRSAKAPASPAKTCSLLGMANYCGRCIPDLSTTTQPMRDLMKQDTEWKWTTEHQVALDTLKETHLWLSHGILWPCKWNRAACRCECHWTRGNPCSAWQAEKKCHG